MVKKRPLSSRTVEERLARLERKEAKRKERMKAAKERLRAIKASCGRGRRSAGTAPVLEKKGDPDAVGTSSGAAPAAGLPSSAHPLPLVQAPRGDPIWPPAEFTLRVNGDLRRQLSFPASFTDVFVRHRITHFKLRMDGCGNGPIWARTCYSPEGVMSIDRGWKTFVRCHGVLRVSNLEVSYDGWWGLSFKAFDLEGQEAVCCLEDDGGVLTDSEEE